MNVLRIICTFVVPHVKNKNFTHINSKEFLHDITWLDNI